MNVELIKKFAKFCQKKLGIKKLPKIKLTTTRDEVKTTAGYKRGKEVIVYTKGRHTVDVCRSLGHELKHHKQFEDQEFDLHDQVQDVGGKYEDEANAVAGQLIKQFAYSGNMNIYESKKMLTEGRLEDAKRNFPSIHPSLIDFISKKDPSGNNKYLNWIIKQLRKSLAITPATIHGQFVDNALKAVKLYDQLLPYYTSNRLDPNALPPKVINKPKDINNYESVEQVNIANQMIESFYEAQLTEKEMLRNADVVHESENFLIVRINTPGEACYFGSGTKWCISQQGDRSILNNYLKHSDMFFVVNKDLEKTDPYWKIIYLIPKGMRNRGGYSIYLANDKQATLEELEEHEPKLIQMLSIIELWGESPISRSAETIKHGNSKLYALTQFVGDDMLSHYKLVEVTYSMVHYEHNDGKTSTLYAIGSTIDIEAAADVLYAEQINQNPKLILRRPELISAFIDNTKLRVLAFDYLGFNSLHGQTPELQSKIKEFYPVPPMKLKSDQIDENKFDLARLNQIEESLNETQKLIKNKERSIKNLTYDIQSFEKNIAAHQAKLGVLKIRVKQIKDNPELLMTLNGKIDGYNTLIGRKSKDLTGLIDFKAADELQLKNAEAVYEQLSTEYTDIVNEIEATNQIKTNYEYSPEQIKKAKDKIALNVAEDPIKWIKKLRLKPENIIKFFDVDKLAQKMRAQFMHHVKNIGPYKFVSEKKLFNKETYYIFTR